jgi:DNA-binding transcriptional LysR family regulator
MKIDTLGVQAFVAIAESGSFNRAAAALSITQSALSRRLRGLETDLGVRLIERTTRTVALSRSGAGFLPQARRLLSELAASLNEIRETGNAMRGDVTLACVPTMGVHYLPEVLREYAANFPNNRIRLLDHASSAVAEAVLSREAEFGINVARLRHADLDSTPLLQDSFVLVCRRDHPLAQHRRVSWQQLKGHRLIFPGASSSNEPLLEQALGVEHRSLAIFYEVQRSSTAVGLVAQGVGIAVVPRLAMQNGAYPSLRVVDLIAPTVSRTFNLLTRKGAVLSPAARNLYELLLERRSRFRTRALPQAASPSKSPR